MDGGEIINPSLRSPFGASSTSYEEDTFETTTTGRASSLHRWSSVTETIQFASESSGSGSFHIELSSSENSKENDTQTVNTESEVTSASLYSDEFESGESTFETDDFSDSHGSGTRELFLLHKLNILKQGKFPSKGKETREKCLLDDSTDKGLYNKDYQEFCQRKKDLLKKSQQRNRDIKSASESKQKKESKEKLVNTRKAELLRVENLRTKFDKASTTNFHQPKHCHKCHRLRAQAREEQFLREKKHLLEKQLLECKIDKHLYEKDAAMLIADIIQAGPKPSDAPQEIWDRLLRKGKYTSCSNR